MQDLLDLDCSVTLSGFDQIKYRHEVESSSAFKAHMENATWETAQALTKVIWNAAVESMAADAVLLVNSSTGKDSSATASTWIEVALERRAAGLRLPRSIVAIADTGSEFPEMALRMESECAAINAFASKEKLPMECRIVRARPKNRLLVEIIGRGKSLPPLHKGKGASTDGSAWCMQRVKKGPLDTIIKDIRTEAKFFVQALGVRSGESVRRTATIAEYSSNLPFGLSRLGEQGGDPDRIGLSPIVHWTDDMIREWMIVGRCQWDSKSMAAMRSIYRKGSTMEEFAGECGLRVTQDGGVTNVCSDLSGARMGCWMCLMSVNKSLRNFAAVDARYDSLRRFHAYLYGHHRRGRRIAERRDHLGFNGETMFPKGFTFKERYFMLMLIFRAEIESNFTLLAKEDIEAIGLAWKRDGVWTVDPKEARADAIEWRKTGKPVMTYLKNTSDIHRLFEVLGEGLPGGAYQHLVLGKEFNKFRLSHMIGLDHFNTPVVPIPLAYVFTDDANKDNVFVMITDTPSVLGSKMKTDMLNGTMLGRWRCAGIRRAESWENEISDGRVLFYKVSVKAQQELLRKAVDTNWDIADKNVFSFGKFDVSRTISVPHANLSLVYGMTDDDPYADHVQAIGNIASMGSKMTEAEYNKFKQVVCDASFLSEELSDNAAIAKKKLFTEFSEKLHLLEADTEEGKALRKGFENAATQHYGLAEMAPKFLQYVEAMGYISSRIKEGKASASLVQRLIYIFSLLAVDPDEGEKEMAELDIIVMTEPKQYKPDQHIAA